jgi:hypothetical protein
VPAGAEFRVNTYTTGGQVYPTVASDGGGNFVVAWGSNALDGSSEEVKARRYHASGTPLGPEFRVNTTALFAGDPSVAVTPDGRFVIVWSVFTYPTGAIVGQRFDASGRAQGAEFRVDSHTSGYGVEPAVAIAPDGAFVVVWHLEGQGQDVDVFGQRFDASGALRGGQFRVNTYTTYRQSEAAVTVIRDGGFVVAWNDLHGHDGSYEGVFGQRFDPMGTPVGGEFRVNTYTTLTQASPSIASAPDGRFVLVWGSSQGGDANSEVHGQLYQVSGAPNGGEFQVNTYTTAFQWPYGPSAVAMDARGNFVVSWYSGYEYPDFGIFGQRFDANGQRRGGEFQVNAQSLSFMKTPAMASDPSGNLVIAWRTPDDGAFSFGITARRIGGVFPAALAADDGDNDVVEVGDSFSIVTAWRNHTGAPQTLSGVATGHIVPPGLTMIVSPLSVYGTVPEGAVGSCAGFTCFAGALTGTRPSGHVDVSVGEFLLPQEQGQEKRWVLHVGESFGDVPRTSPFYRFVETLLHQGVTAGCSGTTYCPFDSTTREQMSVFVLAAKEGTGYAPPACTTPVFADVPASSPFCRWIEELARRGVTGGCAPNLYCPTAAVTREQMAVFLLRTLDPTLTPPACAPPNIFNDVPETSAFCPWIEELARRGITGGCGGGNYCPTAAVTREQMAVFLTQTFGLTLYGP